MAVSHKTFTASNQSKTCQTWFLMMRTPFWLLPVLPPPPHSLNQEMMEELIMNPADPKGMSQTIVIILTMIGTKGRSVE